ncbi:MAG: tRNA (guanosine(37)-N1)-methyltransferase TrmD [Treponema sp.]|jgi:tRNA (guanine37-N1)-methyltransferase|nr:tRNA (guanosine(37)-N1)-methyltransferase TrmD [Treponema sp.]
MTYTVLTLFPEITDAYFSASIMARAVERGMVSYRALNIRDFAPDRHRTCDDAPYGGGPGMLMLPGPLGRALEAAGVARKGGEGPAGTGLSPVEQAGPSDTRPADTRRVIYLSPSGRPFNQALAGELISYGELVLLCGRYEGIDQRIIDLYIDEEISVGDYVLSSGEAAALVLIDATYRLVDQVIASESLEEETFSGGLLEYPQYTRPEMYANLQVPEVLLSGHHEHIRRWRLRKRVEKTLALRPDLISRGLATELFDAETRGIIQEMRES